MSEEKVKIRLPNARQKLQSLFPEDNRGDVRIVFGKKSFKLQKAFLRLESGYFKRTFGQPTEVLEIKQDFPQNSFANVLKCFYGFTIEVPRGQILDYYPIVKFLQMESLLRALRQDMTVQADRYDVIALLQLAHRFNEQQLFENCLAQVEKQGYKQLLTARKSLLRCPSELFKLLVKTHNRLKAERATAVTFLEVDQLIRDFSQVNKLNEQQYIDLKFELIDKKSLNAQEYKEIFLDDAKKKGEEHRSMMKIGPDPSSPLYNSAFTSNIFSASKLTESVIEPIKKMNNELTLQLEHTYQKKRNEELQKENANLAAELNEVKNKLNDFCINFESLKEVVTKMQGKSQEKERIDKEHATTIKKLQKTCQDLRGELTSRNDAFKKLQDRMGKLQKQPQKRISVNPNGRYIIPDDEQDQSKTIVSLIVPGPLIKQIAKPAAEPLIIAPNGGAFKKKNILPSPVTAVDQAKIQEEPDELDLEQMYSSRLSFDQEPLGCRKQFLPKIADIITTEGFQKKKLRLLFRRSNNAQSYGQPNDIRCRDSLLFIICTKLNVVFGGFISVQIPKNPKEYIADESAFLFNLSKSNTEKISIKRSRISEAVYMSSDYLIGFSNDVMISLDPIKQKSQCAFPDAYDTSKENRSPKWLTGQQSSFSIRSIQVYEVREQLMIMDL